MQKRLPCEYMNKSVVLQSVVCTRDVATVWAIGAETTGKDDNAPRRLLNEVDMANGGTISKEIDLGNAYSTLVLSNSQNMMFAGEWAVCVGGWCRAKQTSTAAVIPTPTVREERGMRQLAGRVPC